MREIWTIARREFRSYFDHPTAYILVVAFLVLGLFLAFRSLFATGAATMRFFFSLLPWLFIVFVPAITMRSLAEERRTGTYEWLIAQPLGEASLIGGKFLGNWLFALVALAGSIPTALGILLASDADLGVMIAQYAGAALLALQLVALGILASSLTKNQITAFILAAALSFGLILIGLDITLIGLPPALAAGLARLSLISHFENIARGVLDLRDLLYFISTAALFLGLAYLSLAGERLSRTQGALARLRTGVAVAAVGVLVLNLLGSHIRGRLDLTSGQLFTLSDGTRQVLQGLDDVVTIKLVVSSELPPEVSLTLRDVRDLLADYRSAGDGKVRLIELNPDRDEGAAREASALGIESIQFNVLRGDEVQLKRGWFGLAVEYTAEREVIPMISRTDDLEYRLTSMIAGLTTESKPRLAFLTGYGAQSVFSYPTLQRVLEDGYSIESFNLERDTAFTLTPEAFDLVVLAAPTRELADNAIEALEGYLDSGGAGLFLLESHQVSPGMPFASPVPTGLDSLLEARGLRLRSGLVYDLRSNERVSLGQRGIFPVISPYPYWPIVRPASEHMTTRGLDALSLGWASALEILDTTRVRPLWQTTSAAGLDEEPITIQPDALALDPEPEELQTQVVAAIAEPEEGAGRLVVVADADFARDDFVQGNPRNLVFAANLIDWLAQDETLIAIRSKNRTPPPLTFESEVGEAFLRWGNLIGVPLIFILIGMLRVAHRRRLGQRRWEEVAI